MSVDHVSKVLGLPSDVNGAERMVALVLAEAANIDTDECWPSTATIAARAGIRQERYVVRAVRALADRGLVHVEANGCPDERVRKDRRSNLYRLVGALAVAGVRDAQGRVDATGGTSALDGGARRAANGGARKGGLTRREITVTEPELSLSSAAQPSLMVVEPNLLSAAAFDEFWQAYPKRNGKRLGRGKAMQQWMRMAAGDRAAARTGVEHYRAACDAGMFAKDAHRWLRDRDWVDWQTPAEAAPTARGARRSRAVNDVWKNGEDGWDEEIKALAARREGAT